MNSVKNSGRAKKYGAWLGLCLGAVLSLSACGGGGDSSSAAPTPTPTSVAATISLQGKVLDAQDGAPISHAVIKAGAITAVSDASGKYVLNNVAPSARVSLVVTATNYAETVKLTSVMANTATTFDLKLLKVGATALVAQATGGVVTVPGSVAQVSLPENFAMRADGSAPVGGITVTVTPISPALDSSFMPGDYTTVVGTQAVAIESFGALTVNLMDASGPLNVAAGKVATIRIPVSTRSSQALPGSVPLFYVSPQTGRWVQEGSATLQGVAPSQYYQGTVTHFSTWNADQVMDTITVTGCVTDEAGLRVGGVTVNSDGIDYSGSASSTTDASGSFTVTMRRNSKATLAGFSGNKFTNEMAVGPQADSFSVPTCLTLATALNSIKIKLTWGENPADVDSYLTLPTGEVIYYSNRGDLLKAPYVNLDVDDTRSFGPEIVTIRRPMVGTYQYAVRNYTGSHLPGITASPTKVELTIADSTTIYAPPAGEADEGKTVWTVFNLQVAANCGVTISPVNTWSLTAPVDTPTLGTATYCTP
jgi:Carboxypeptidase regulatory-like domain